MTYKPEPYGYTSYKDYYSNKKVSYDTYKKPSDGRCSTDKDCIYGACKLFIFPIILRLLEMGLVPSWTKEKHLFP